jgi:hypothetical protein
VATFNSISFADFLADPTLSMCVNPTDVFASSSMSAAAACAAAAAAASSSSSCYKDFVFNSGRRRSSAKSLVLPFTSADLMDDDMNMMAMDDFNLDKLL